MLNIIQSPLGKFESPDFNSNNGPGRAAWLLEYLSKDNDLKTLYINPNGGLILQGSGWAITVLPEGYFLEDTSGG